MADLVETVGVEAIVRKAGHQPADNFEKVYSQIHRDGLTSVLDELDAATRAYFGKLRLPSEPTVYDRLVLSLRPKDLIVTFNWDPLLGQAYKRWRRIGGAVPRIAFLHGNVDIGVDLEKRVSGFLSDEPISGRKLSPTRLLYPVEQKNYTIDPFIAEQWHQAADGLGEAYYVTIFGYSAPATDRGARTLSCRTS